MAQSEIHVIFENEFVQSGGNLYATFDRIKCLKCLNSEESKQKLWVVGKLDTISKSLRQDPIVILSSDFRHTVFPRPKHNSNHTTTAVPFVRTNSLILLCCLVM